MRNDNTSTKAAAADSASGDKATVPARWIRLPRHGEKEEFTGLTHGGFYDLLKTAGLQIKSASLKQPGQKRGVRVVWLPSIHEYFCNLANTQGAYMAAVKQRTREVA